MPTESLMIYKQNLEAFKEACLDKDSVKFISAEETPDAPEFYQVYFSYEMPFILFYLGKAFQKLVN